jgi:hypothetical protein
LVGFSVLKELKENYKYSEIREATTMDQKKPRKIFFFISNFQGDFKVLPQYAIFRETNQRNVFSQLRVHDLPLGYLSSSMYELMHTVHIY